MSLAGAIHRLKTTSIQYDSLFPYSWSFSCSWRQLTQALVQRNAMMVDRHVDQLVAFRGGWPGLLRLPLPTSLLEELCDHGFPVSFAYSCIYRCQIAFIGILRAHVYAFRVLYETLRHKLAQRRQASSPWQFSVLFYGVNRNCFASGSRGVKLFSMLTWFFQSQYFDHKTRNVYAFLDDLLDTRCNHLRVQSVSRILAPFPSLRQGLRFCLWSARAFLVAYIDLLFGKTDSASLLLEAVMAAEVRLAKPDQLAKTYFFTCSVTTRPLWSYELERRGCEIVYLFYSANQRQPRNVEDRMPVKSPYELMSWPRYAAWSETQSQWISRYDSASIVDIVGPVWLDDDPGCEDLEPALCLTIAVFDVQPHRASVYAGYGLSWDYYTPDVVIPFLRILFGIASHRQGRVLFKRKRSIGKDLHPVYSAYLNSVVHDCSIHAVSPSVSAVRVIQKSNIVVSLPFTSTAHVARSMGVPSAYFDPTGTIDFDDPAADGIPVFGDTVSLQRWIDLVVLPTTL